MTLFLLNTFRTRGFIARRVTSIQTGYTEILLGRKPPAIPSKPFSVLKAGGGYTFVDEDENDMDRRIKEAMSGAHHHHKNSVNRHQNKKLPPISQQHQQPIRREYVLSIRNGTCSGCGTKLQCTDQTQPGFVPKDILHRILHPEKEQEENENEKEISDSKIKYDMKKNELKKIEELYDINETDEDKLMNYNNNNNKNIDLKKFNSMEIITKKQLNELEKQNKDDMSTCQRCHKLRNYGIVDKEMRAGWSKNNKLLQPLHFVNLLSEIKTGPKCVVLTLVDVFDFHGSILPHLKDIIGTNPLHIAVNKVDLLPLDYSVDRVKQWVLQEAKQQCGLDRLRLSDIHLISAKTGEGIGPLLDATRGHAKQRHGDIYVVGAANVGKSSLLNRLAKFDGGQSWGGGQVKKKLKKKKQLALSSDGSSPPPFVMKKGITTSSFPGTTLDFIKMNVGSNVNLIDTPGLILQHQLTSILEPKELKAVIPLKRVDHVTLRVMEGKSVFLGGLARVEFISGRPFFMTFFMNHDVTIHPSPEQGDEADEFVKKHSGSILTPPFDSERCLGEMKAHDFEVEGDGWIQAGCDIVISGLGWFSITGVGNCNVRVIAPEGVMVVQRDPLMPFEAKDTMAKSTGGKIFKKVFKRKKRLR